MQNLTLIRLLLISNAVHLYCSAARQDDLRRAALLGLGVALRFLKNLMFYFLVCAAKFFLFGWCEWK